MYAQFSGDELSTSSGSMLRKLKNLRHFDINFDYFCFYEPSPNHEFILEICSLFYVSKRLHFSSIMLPIVFGVQ